MKRGIRRALLSLGVGLTAIVLFVLYQNSYNMTEKKIEIETPQGVLTGTLVLPKDVDRKLGLVVFIHGDGPINDTYNDGYKPLWEKFASVGYASLSLNKRGMNGSTGNWLEQSMEDRAEEALHVINWAKSLPMVDDTRIGLWGASQAGWVIPKIVRDEPSIAFSIVVSPAINWISQGKFNTRKQMEQEGLSTQEMIEKERYNEQILNLLKKRSSYEDYLQVAHTDDVISRERWGFITKNFESDATNELINFKSPVHLVLGGQDINVDVADTEQIYRQQIPTDLLSVTFLPEADHSMLKKEMVHSELRAFLTAILFPRKLVDEQYYKDLLHFLGQFDMHLRK
ncbi:alpha/beta hydrolase family protein [Paenibacillus sp. KN14-4R]|uniref:alpha/beta hydrolase family protein n=1 Tax=Paenibacillus sp. KN14-4R TaxID=3445773 RepID=UPI003F9FD071